MRFHTAASIAATAAPVLLIDATTTVVAASTTVARDAVAASIGSVDGKNAPISSSSSSSLARPKKSLFSNRMDRARRLAKKPESSPTSAIDTGVLSNRKLQATEYYCPRDQCPASLCDCADTGADMTDCHAELADVCKAGIIGDCVYEGYVEVYQELYCPFVRCLGKSDSDGGGTLEICDCHFYESYCERLESVECLGGRKLKDGEKFFGCDQTRLEEVCGMAKECLNPKADVADVVDEATPMEDAAPEGVIGARVVESPSIFKMKGANAASTRGTTAVAFGTVMAATVSFGALQFLGVFTL